jgi:hypothetical protein
MVRDEVEPGYTRPTNLLQEVLLLRLAPNDGSQGSTFIDGAHMVLVGPARGHLHLLYQNWEVDEQFLSNFAECLCTHVYQYLCKEKHFMWRCCQKILLAWIDAKEGLRAMDSRWDSGTYNATPL